MDEKERTITVTYVRDGGEDCIELPPGEWEPVGFVETYKTTEPGELFVWGRTVFRKKGDEE